MHRRRPVHPFTRLFASGFFLQCQCNAKHFSTPTKQPIYCYAPQVTEDWVKPGAVVLDVGINVREPASKDHKHRLVGDVHFAQVSKVASAISPVPGGAHLLTSSVIVSFCSTGCSILLYRLLCRALLHGSRPEHDRSASPARSDMQYAHDSQVSAP